ncbi:MAG: DUF3299 domain-containing protein [Planctomycetes bacterium]|nr:DUF3299 domain-containing protein [Planctomycetota bacterium]
MPSMMNYLARLLVLTVIFALVATGGGLPEPRVRAAETTPTKSITFDTVKFPMEKTDAFKREMITPEIEKLVGRRVKIRGYMLPTMTQDGITQFILVRDNMECCFGPGAALYDCMTVEMKGGKSTSYSLRPIAVEGMFQIRELLDPVDGVVRAVFHLDAEAVQ